MPRGGQRHRMTDGYCPNEGPTSAWLSQRRFSLPSGSPTLGLRAFPPRVTPPAAEEALHLMRVLTLAAAARLCGALLLLRASVPGLVLRVAAARPSAPLPAVAFLFAVRRRALGGMRSLRRVMAVVVGLCSSAFSLDRSFGLLRHGAARSIPRQDLFSLTRQAPR